MPGKKNKLLTFQSHKMHSVTKCICAQKMSKDERGTKCSLEILTNRFDTLNFIVKQHKNRYHGKLSQFISICQSGKLVKMSAGVLLN